MTDKPRKSRRGRRPAPESERKDRVIQTRVPQDLEDSLRHAAERERVTVSHLIRNVLEDSFRLVDGIVADSSQLVDNVARDARRLASAAKGQARRSRFIGHGFGKAQCVTHRLLFAGIGPHARSSTSRTQCGVVDSYNGFQTGDRIRANHQLLVPSAIQVI